MNTKQIWQALTCSNVTEPFFDGVFSYDTLKNIKKKPELIICNTDPSNKPVSHWVLFFSYENGVDFYDSLGNDLSYYGKEFVNFVSRFSKHYQVSKIRTQPKDSSLCGYYCLYYAFKSCKGNNMQQIINSMKTASHVVNFVNKQFKFCSNHKCARFQTCIKL